MTLHYLFLSTGKLILPWNKWLFFGYKTLYKFLSQNEILAPVSQITRMDSRKYNPLNYDIFPTPKQMQRALKPARWTHACTKGALIYHKNIVKKYILRKRIANPRKLFFTSLIYQNATSAWSRRIWSWAVFTGKCGVTYVTGVTARGSKRRQKGT